ncbi:MAG: hypothetical protein ACK5ZY_04865 [Cyclobacteriaceae bacterium]|jgi:hypothetical protein
MTCIFCDTENSAKSVEHVVSESFGNKHYVIEKGKVCDDCNGKFSKFEGVALTNSVFIMERARFGIETKKGKNAKGQVGELKIEGDEDFRKNYITVKGKGTLHEFNPETNTGVIYISSFDKSEVATSKLLLKTGLESMYTSRREIFDRNDFSELKSFLTAKTNTDWPFMTTDFELKEFRSVPQYTDKHRLNKIRCILRYLELDDKTLLFKFKYGGIPMTINLLNRNLDWIASTCRHDEKATLYPEHYRNKMLKIGQ